MDPVAKKPFRFGVNLAVPAGRREWVDKSRKAEELGYDVVCVPDHLGAPAPFPALVLAAEATSSVRLCPFVLNTSFYNPALLARDVAGTDQYVEGRLELGLGTGYVKAEFEAAGLPFPGAGARIDHLEHTVRRLRVLFAEEEPRPAQHPGPPLLMAGHRDRMLRLAAREADIVGFSGATFDRAGTSASVATAEQLGERVDFVRGEAGERADRIELNLLIQKVVLTGDRESALQSLRPYASELTDEQFSDVPILLVGTARQVADQLRAQRERFGFSYLTVLEPDLETFAEVIELLR